jgi:steroid delta-isomerase-like uncharacterized protein
MKIGCLLTAVCVLGASSAAMAKPDNTSSLAVTGSPPTVNTTSGLDTASKEAQNKAVALRVFQENFNQGKFQVAEEIYARDFQNHGLHRAASLQEDQDAVHAEKKAFPDLKMTVDMMVAEGDLVSVVWTFRGTHTAAGYGGLPPTGAKIETRGITVWRIVDGKIQDEWTAFDELPAYLQVASQVKWVLLGILITLLAFVVILERVVCAAIWRVWSKNRRI